MLCIICIRRLVKNEWEGRCSCHGHSDITSCDAFTHLFTGWLWSSPPVPPSTTGTPSHLPHTTHCDVYLGGSCGATSWRRDDIIPILNQHGVTFFDPQVSEWDPSLISVEQAAKNQVSRHSGV